MTWLEILAVGYVLGLLTAYPVAHGLSRAVDRLTDYLCGPPTRKGLGPPSDRREGDQ